LAINDECVASIMTTLESNDTLSVIGQPVNNLTFTFITPLGTNYNNIAARLAG
jgi:hypothetical protein